MDPAREADDVMPKSRHRGTHTLLAKHLHGKMPEWDALGAHQEPLRLLDLPVDILQAILKELTHTNDLTSLALTHSALHALVIPHIYSRFDIVWPDANATFENRMGVDALTYGLATLVMAQDVFGEAPYQRPSEMPPCAHCVGWPAPSTVPPPVGHPRPVRRGNYFAQYTRKFSLGNGPADWVQEYLITKEGGKMLGTLVALAVGRMRNLETFIWDMPTGVLRDVWLALASLGQRHDGQPCRLERVWVRWHDNQDQGPLASPPPLGSAPGGGHVSNLPSILAGSGSSLFQIPPYPRVEFPTFSILPPLRSLSVLDIDELPYAEEMSVLIERSRGRLQELRFGMASHAQFDIWARPAEDRAPVLPSMMPTLDDQSPRPGGILGILVHRFCDPFARQGVYDPVRAAAAEATPVADSAPAEGKERELGTPSGFDDISQLGALLSTHTLQEAATAEDGLAAAPAVPASHVDATLPTVTTQAPRPGSVAATADRSEPSPSKLALDTLEIERVYLSITVLSVAIDWTRLTSLTLLGCRNHEQLWKMLRRTYTPNNRRRMPSSAFRASSNGSMRTASSAMPGSLAAPTPSPSDYLLRLKRLHTDTVSPTLIAFIKDTLAPDSLEWLFLQENSTYKSPVSIDTIYKHAVRRHRSSLRKLLIDSTLRADDPDAPDTNWRRWVVHRDLITCITSGKMALRELSMSIDYKEWHYFLRRLPNAIALRSLHIVHIAEHVHGAVHSREAALQVLDIVALRPELELCYLGVQNQCFELLECAKGASSAGLMLRSGVMGGPSGEDSELDQGLAPAAGRGHPHHPHHSPPLSHHPHPSAQPPLPDEDPDSGHGNDVSDFDALSDSDDERSDGENPEGRTADSAKPTWRLREILFYDDKIAIFKARHGRL